MKLREAGVLPVFHTEEKESVGRVFERDDNPFGGNDRMKDVHHARLIRLPEHLGMGRFLPPEFDAYQTALKEGKLTFGRPEGPITADAMVLTTAASGKWTEPQILPVMQISMHPNAQVLHYGSGLFEGMTAERNKSGTINVYNLQGHYARYVEGASELNLPAVSPQAFEKAILDAVRANERFIPPCGAGRLYIRPFQFDNGPKIGVANSASTTLMVTVTPVGNETAYFGKLEKPIVLGVPIDRTRSGKRVGEVKFLGNYGPTTLQVRETAELGWSGVAYAGRPVTGEFTTEKANQQTMRETHASNLLFFEDLGERKWRVVTPSLDTGDILPGLNRKLILELARREGWDVEEREVTLEEATNGTFTVAAACGTAAYITPVHGFHSFDTQATEEVQEMPADATPEQRRRRVGVPKGELRMLPFAKNLDPKDYGPATLMPEPIKLLISRMLEVKRGDTGHELSRELLTPVPIDTAAK